MPATLLGSVAILLFFFAYFCSVVSTSLTGQLSVLDLHSTSHITSLLNTGVSYDNQAQFDKAVQSFGGLVSMSDKGVLLLLLCFAFALIAREYNVFSPVGILVCMWTAFWVCGFTNGNMHANWGLGLFMLSGLLFIAAGFWPMALKWSKRLSALSEGS